MIHETNEFEPEAGTGWEFVVPLAPRVIEECDWRGFLRGGLLIGQPLAQ
jgi:hypothetical protein